MSGLLLAPSSSCAVRCCVRARAELILCSDVSRHSEISIQCYLRTEEPKRGGDGIPDDMGNDLFMGGVRFTPDFDDLSSQDQWYDLVGGQGRIQIGVAFKPSTVRFSIFIAYMCERLMLPQGQSLTIDDFELITVIGKGSFGKVCRGCMHRLCALHSHRVF